jgi:twitching motility protein PilT
MEPTDDLDALADELERINRDIVARGTGLEVLLRMMAEREASDLLLVAGEPPVFRVDGKVHRADAPLLDGEDIEQLVTPMLPAHAQRAFREGGIADAAIRLPGVGRFRVNLHFERGRAAAVVRMLPSVVPRLASLNIPAGTEALSRQ